MVQERKLSIFEKYLTVWVGLCIVAGIVLGKVAPGVAKYFDSMAISVKGAPVVSIPIAVCLFFMMYPIMVKIDFARVLRAGRNVKPVGLTLFVNDFLKALFNRSHGPAKRIETIIANNAVARPRGERQKRRVYNTL